MQAVLISLHSFLSTQTQEAEEEMLLNKHISSPESQYEWEATDVF